MASEVDICNLALSHFGQAADINSIDPPDGSVEAGHASTFYPIARDEILEQGDFSFARKRTTLAELTNDRADWTYKYALPADCLKPRVVLLAGYDHSLTDGQPFEIEGDSLYTDAEDAVLVYTYRLTDPTKFSPLFTTAVSWRLASYMVGPITKDPTGRSQATLYQRSEVEMAKAGVSTANIDRTRATYVPTAKRVR